MSKSLWQVGLLAMILAVPPWAWGNSFFNRAPQFSIPTGEIAFMGCYWSPVSITGYGGDSSSPQVSGPNSPVYQSGGVQVGVNSGALGGLLADQIMGDEKPPEPADATLIINQKVVDKSSGLGLSLMPVNYSTVYQNALLMHLLSPAQWAYNPQLTRYCGMRPYILIGIIDYCDAYPCPVKMTDQGNVPAGTYWGKRTLLEQDAGVFAGKGERHVVALELYLVSTTDGSTLWQGNLMAGGGKMSGYAGLAEGLVEDALKNLMKK